MYHLRESLTLTAIRQLRQVSYILDSCTIAASYEVIFFFLAFGRCRSEARSLHEHKQSERHLYKDPVGPSKQANQN